MVERTPTRRIDWHRVLDDLAYLGMVGEALAARTGLPVHLLQRVASGKQRPAPGAADRIAWLWCILTGKAPEFLPRTSDPESAPRPDVPGIDRDDEPEQSHAQLQSIVMVWAQIASRAGRT